MNNNERELERAGYDNWKLSNREDEIRRRAGRYGMVDYFFDLKERLGKCPCCNKLVYDNQLFVEDEETDETYHLSCYNEMKAEEEEE